MSRVVFMGVHESGRHLVYRDVSGISHSVPVFPCLSICVWW